MHGQFLREIPEKFDEDKSWHWLSRSQLKIGTERLLCSEEQAIRINYVNTTLIRHVKAPVHIM